MVGGDRVVFMLLGWGLVLSTIYCYTCRRWDPLRNNLKKLPSTKFEEASSSLCVMIKGCQYWPQYTGFKIVFSIYISLFFSSFLAYRFDCLGFEDW